MSDEETIEKTINEFKAFLDQTLPDEWRARLARNKDHFVINFNELAMHNPWLAERLLDEPERTLQEFSLVKSRYDCPNQKNIKFRFYNLPDSSQLPIGKIRSRHIGKFVTVEGVVRQKSDVRFHVSLIKFECNGCGNITPMIQLGKTIQQPKICKKCAYKSSFRQVGVEVFDAYKILVEEDPEFTNKGQYSHVHILCKSDLSDDTVYDRFGPGSKVAVTGWIVANPNEQGKSRSTELNHYLHANHIRIISEGYDEIEVTPQDKETIENWVVNAGDPIDSLSQTLYREIWGYQWEKRGIILQMFGGGKKTSNLSQSRGDVHVLLIGEPGSAKSQLLKITQSAMPKARYTVGTGVTGVGLTAAVVKDDLLGGFVLEPGILPLSSGGLLCLDELDKASADDTNSLHEALEQQTISVSKANIHATLRCETTILAAANPKYGIYDSFQSVYSQIDLPVALVNRFDLIFPIRTDKMTDDDYAKVVKTMMGRWRHEKHKSLSEKELLFIKKYISYARSITPLISEEVSDEIFKRFINFRDRASGTEKNQRVPITGRLVEAFRRLSQARARAYLREEVTKEDVQYAYQILDYSLSQIGINPETGTLDLTYLATGGKSATKKMILDRIIQKIDELERALKPGEKGAEFQEIYDGIKEGGPDEQEFDRLLSKLKDEGQVYEPASGRYRVNRG